MLPAAVGAGALGGALFTPEAPKGEAARKTQSLNQESKKGLPSLIRRRMSRLSTMATLSCDEALRSAKLNIEEEKEDIGFVFGTGYGELDTTSRMFIAGIEENMSPTLFHNSVHNAPLGYAGIITGIKGVSVTVSDGHISGESSIIQAAELISGGVSGILAAGAADERYEFPLFEDPGQKSDPGEGSGFLIMEKGERARNRNVSLSCAVSGWSMCAYRGADPGDRESRVECVCSGIVSALSGPLSSMDVDPDGLGIFTHLWGGGIEDEIIEESVKKVFGKDVTVWSSLELCGAFPASGAVRALAAVLSIERNSFPRSARVSSGFKGEVENILLIGMDPEGDVALIVFSRIA